MDGTEKTRSGPITSRKIFIRYLIEMAFFLVSTIRIGGATEIHDPAKLIKDSDLVLIGDIRNMEPRKGSSSKGTMEMHGFVNVFAPELFIGDSPVKADQHRKMKLPALFSCPAKEVEEFYKSQKGSNLLYLKATGQGKPYRILHYVHVESYEERLPELHSQAVEKAIQSKIASLPKKNYQEQLKWIKRGKEMARHREFRDPWGAGWRAPYEMMILDVYKGRNILPAQVVGELGYSADDPQKVGLDGDHEILLSQYGATVILFTNSQGTFFYQRFEGLLWGSNVLFAKDLDGDGIKEIFVVTAGGNGAGGSWGFLLKKIKDQYEMVFRTNEANYSGIELRRMEGDTREVIAVNETVDYNRIYFPTYYAWKDGQFMDVTTEYPAAILETYKARFTQSGVEKTEGMKGRWTSEQESMYISRRETFDKWFENRSPDRKAFWKTHPKPSWKDE